MNFDKGGCSRGQVEERGGVWELSLKGVRVEMRDERREVGALQQPQQQNTATEDLVLHSAGGMHAGISVYCP